MSWLRLTQGEILFRSTRIKYKKWRIDVTLDVKKRRFGNNNNKNKEQYSVESSKEEWIDFDRQQKSGS